MIVNALLGFAQVDATKTKTKKSINSLILDSEVLFIEKNEACNSVDEAKHSI